MRLNFVIACWLIGCLLTPFSLQASADQKDIASLLVLIDLSPSMEVHRKKLRELAPIVEKAMENARCEFRVAVGSIEYKGMERKSHMIPWHEPRGEAWITQDTPDGPMIIGKRIATPHEAVYPHYDGDQEQGIPNNGDERTYSSLLSSIQANWETLKESQVIGTLLLTDAVPAYETDTPENVAQSIFEKLGSIPYLSAIIAANIHSGMIVPERFIKDPATNTMVLRCGPDYEGPQVPMMPIQFDTWDSPNPDAINQFTDAVYGSQWDVCEPDYDQQLKEFVEMILAVGGCLPIS